MALMKGPNKEVAFGELYRRYVPLVFGTCLKYLKQKADAEDSAQLIMIRLYEYLCGASTQHLGTWLHVVARNHCVDALRKSGNRLDINLPEDYFGRNADSFVDDSSPLGLFSQDSDGKNNLLSLLHKGIGDLSETQRHCISMFYIDNKSYRQCADMLNIDINSVKSSIQNGKRKLQLAIGKLTAALIFTILNLFV